MGRDRASRGSDAQTQDPDGRSHREYLTGGERTGGDEMNTIRAEIAGSAPCSRHGDTGAWLAQQANPLRRRVAARRRRAREWRTGTLEGSRCRTVAISRSVMELARRNSTIERSTRGSIAIPR